MIRNLTAQAHWDSPLGPMLIVVTDSGLAGLWFDGQTHHPGEFDAPVNDDHPWIVQTREQLTDYFAGRTAPFSVPLDLQGTTFQKSVWQALLQIDSGRTMTYGEIARVVGSPAAVRAAGAAIGRNPITIVVPCHRVVGHNGNLTGYAGGLHRKQALLSLESADSATLFNGI